MRYDFVLFTFCGRPGGHTKRAKQYEEDDVAELTISMEKYEYIIVENDSQGRFD